MTRQNEKSVSKNRQNGDILIHILYLIHFVLTNRMNYSYIEDEK